jgi:hypothetical protein
MKYEEVHPINLFYFDCSTDLWTYLPELFSGGSRDTAQLDFIES